MSSSHTAFLSRENSVSSLESLSLSLSVCFSLFLFLFLSLCSALVHIVPLIAFSTSVSKMFQSKNQSFYDKSIREAEKKVILPPPPPPLELSGKRIFFYSHFSLKIAGNEFWRKKNLHKIFELKEPYFMPNIATNLSKNNDFANSVHLSIDMSSY